jgi:hypothetical protein
MNGTANLPRRLAGTMMLSIALMGCAGSPSGPSLELVRQIELASKPADHLALAAHYEREASAARATADLHEKMSKSYQASPYEKGGGSMRAHCLSLVKTYQGAAAQYEAIALDHRQMAQRAHP